MKLLENKLTSYETAFYQFDCHHNFRNDIRTDLIKTYGFAVPTKDALFEIGSLDPILEVGCGSGYWASLLEKMDVDIIATDLNQDSGFGFLRKWKHIYTPAEQLDAVSAVKKYPKRNLLFIWPSYDEDWAFEALKESTCKNVIYVGEGSGGCTANEAFHLELESNFERTNTVGIPQFYGLHDFMSVWSRK